MPDGARSPSPDQAAFAGELLDAGLLIETGAPGVYGRGAVFEQLRAGIGRRISAEASTRGAEHLWFPPLMPRAELERTGCLDSFPHLVGSVFSFAGGEPEAALQAQRASRHEDWSEFQEMTGLTLVPAACYPVYPAIAARGPLVPGGVFVELGDSWVFRNEPSEDPARWQIFHQHELVRLGAPEEVRRWREEWAQVGLALLRDWGLAVELEAGNDPFFGRGGRMLGALQREQQLKLELTARIGASERTALASFNAHLDHFASAFGLQAAGGDAAHTACAGFGHERIVLALLDTHGLDPAVWPRGPRAELWGG